MTFAEARGFWVTEKETAYDFPGPGRDRNRKIAPNREVPFGHASMGSVLAVSRVSKNVIGADDTFAEECGFEHGRRARHAE